jgi:hypothetical protein
MDKSTMTTFKDAVYAFIFTQKRLVGGGSMKVKLTK